MKILGKGEKLSLRKAFPRAEAFGSDVDDTLLHGVEALQLQRWMDAVGSLVLTQTTHVHASSVHAHGSGLTINQVVTQQTSIDFGGVGLEAVAEHPAYVAGGDHLTRVFRHKMFRDLKTGLFDILKQHKMLPLGVTTPEMLDDFMTPLRREWLLKDVEAGRIKAMPGAHSAIALMKEIGPVGIYTNSPRTISASLLEAVFGQEFLDAHVPTDFRVFRDDVDTAKLKPEPDGWIELTRRMRLLNSKKPGTTKVGNMVFIEDSVSALEKVMFEEAGNGAILIRADGDFKDAVKRLGKSCTPDRDQNLVPDDNIYGVRSLTQIAA